ncbi:MAG: precorrin-6A/cobalt-precorrin-6A reductase [Colwellia sp.]|nr:precorrin-6A/cobalt-precorrin-6A reductase [Colwellia sp.]
MSLLILGGTADARHLATAAIADNIPVIYSIAGLVRVPKLACRLVVGGFSQFGGLENYIAQQNVSAILDVTHPYAEVISTKAALAAKATSIPYWRFHRPAWQAPQGETWHEFNNLPQLVSQLALYPVVLFSIGQLPEVLITQLKKQIATTSLMSKQNEQQPLVQRQIVRTAAEAKFSLLPSMQWLKAIGPFVLQDELKLMEKYNIKALVTKNSGGESTKAKLQAAQQLAIPIFMQSRPELPAADKLFTEQSSCLQFIRQQYKWYTAAI